MKKYIAIFTLLFFYQMVGQAEAERCLEYTPVKSFSSVEIETIKKELAKTVSAAFVKECNGDPATFESIITMLGPETFY